MRAATTDLSSPNHLKGPTTMTRNFVSPIDTDTKVYPFPGMTGTDIEEALPTYAISFAGPAIDRLTNEFGMTVKEIAATLTISETTLYTARRNPDKDVTPDNFLKLADLLIHRIEETQFKGDPITTSEEDTMTETVEYEEEVETEGEVETPEGEGETEPEAEVEETEKGPREGSMKALRMAILQVNLPLEGEGFDAYLTRSGAQDTLQSVNPKSLANQVRHLRSDFNHLQKVLFPKVETEPEAEAEEGEDEASE